jgi:hypothetical protein
MTRTILEIVLIVCPVVLMAALMEWRHRLTASQGILVVCSGIIAAILRFEGLGPDRPVGLGWLIVWAVAAVLLMLFWGWRNGPNLARQRGTMRPARVTSPPKNLPPASPAE